MRKLFVLLSAVLLLYFGANFRWVHAAIVVASASPAETCAVTLVEDARARVDDLFDGVQSTPWFTCLKEPKLGLGAGVGSAHFAPGLPSILVLGEGGANVDVIAHEWAHAEFAERVGVLTRTYRYPTWFDEGLAMQVDLREDYGLDALAQLQSSNELRPVKAEDIASPSDFFRPGAQGRLHYAWSRQEVASLLRNHKLSDLLADSSLVQE